MGVFWVLAMEHKKFILEDFSWKIKEVCGI